MAQEEHAPELGITLETAHATPPVAGSLGALKAAGKPIAGRIVVLPLSGQKLASKGKLVTACRMCTTLTVFR
jgi:hypothetical protein